MTDSQNNAATGRTRWRRFAAVMGGATVVAGALVFSVANGAVAANLSVSGQSFKVSADHLHGDKFAQFSGVAMTSTSAIPVAQSVIGHAELTNMCQSVDMSKLGMGPIVLKITAGTKLDANKRPIPATADGLQIGMVDMAGDATFNNINIGVDAGQLSGNAKLNGTFAQNADSVDIDGVQQTAYTTTAGKFFLNGLSLKVLTGADAKECY